MRKCCVSDTLNNSRSSRLRSSFWSWCVSFCLRRATNLPVLVGFKKSATLQKPNPRDQERIPSMRKPTSHPKKKTSDSMELWETEVFLTLPTYGKICSTPEDTQNSPRRWFRSFKVPNTKSESWNNPIRQCNAVFPTWQYFLWSLALWTWEIKRTKRLSQTLVHFVAARTNLFTDHVMSGPPIRSKQRHLKTIWDQTLDHPPTVFNSSFLKWWSSRHGMETLYNCTTLIFANSQYLPRSFFA